MQPDEYELEIHEAVPGSRYIKLERAGHFPHCERPDDVNTELAELLSGNNRARWHDDKTENIQLRELPSVRSVVDSRWR